MERIRGPRCPGGSGEGSGPLWTHLWTAPACQRHRKDTKSNFYSPAGRLPVFAAIFAICPDANGPVLAQASSAAASHVK